MKLTKLSRTNLVWQMGVRQFQDKGPWQADSLCHPSREVTTLGGVKRRYSRPKDDGSLALFKRLAGRTAPLESA